MKTKIFLIILAMVFLSIAVGCNKKVVEMDILTVSVSPNEIPSGGQAYIRGYLFMKTLDIYNLQIRVSSGWVTASATFSDDFTAIFQAPANNGELPILVVISVHVYRNNVSTTKSCEAFILTRDEGEKAVPIDYSREFDYLDSDTGMTMTYRPGKRPIESAKTDVLTPQVSPIAISPEMQVN